MSHVIEHHNVSETMTSLAETVVDVASKEIDELKKYLEKARQNGFRAWVWKLLDEVLADVTEISHSDLLDLMRSSTSKGLDMDNSKYSRNALRRMVMAFGFNDVGVSEPFYSRVDGGQ